MLLNITSHIQNSTSNSSDSMETDYSTMCRAMIKDVVIWPCSIITISLFGFPACILVLWELFQRHRRGTPTTPNDVFMLNLTLMDLVFLGFTPAHVLNFLFWKNTSLETFSSFSDAFSMSGRPLFMACICLDCYLAVVHPIMYRARKGLTSRVLMCVVVWALTLACGFQFNFYDMYSYIFILILDLITLPTIVFCDFFILRALKSSDPAGRGLHPQKKKALQIIINSLVITVITYLPVLLAVFLLSISPDNRSKCIIDYTLFSLSNVGSVTMPVLYLSNLGKLDFIYVKCCKTGSDVQ